mmetsp:Transcript_25308/g.41861  ORF Transcript_25308/g.41861 Transcript_25308/m.41861 type:complete len:178 (+) Transcript_25308:994-1527(+)
MVAAGMVVLMVGKVALVGAGTAVLMVGEGLVEAGVVLRVAGPVGKTVVTLEAAFVAVVTAEAAEDLSAAALAAFLDKRSSPGMNTVDNESLLGYFQGCVAPRQRASTNAGTENMDCHPVHSWHTLCISSPSAMRRRNYTICMLDLHTVSRHFDATLLDTRAYTTVLALARTAMAPTT